MEENNMPFNHYAKGQKPTTGGKSSPVPAGIYLLGISKTKEDTTKTGRDMVVVDSAIETQGAYFGKKIRFHNVVFIPAGEPGAGMCLHFLKCIGLPFEGDNLEVDPSAWEHRRFYAHVDVNDKGYNTILEVFAGPEATAEAQEEGQKRMKALEEQIPF
jgi:hypothetical protein